MNKNLSNKYLKIGQTAKALGVSPDTLRRWEKEGKVKPQKTPGGTRLYQDFLKIGAASKALGVSIDTLRRWEKKGKIQSIRTAGGTRLYSPDILTVEPQKISSTEDLLKKIDYVEIESVKTPQIPAQAKIYARIYARIYAYLPLLITTTIIMAVAGAMIFGFKSPPPKSNLAKNVLGALSSQSFLEINSDTQINGALAVRDTINNLTLEATPSASTFELISGDTALTITGSSLIDQDLSTSSSPTFTAVNLSGTTNQILSGANQFTLPGATTTLVGTNTTQTLTNKSLSGASNTFTSIPNSGLSNSKVTITAGTNLSGGGDVSLGSSITLSLASSPSISGVIQLADGTAAAPSLTFTNDTDTGLYRIGSNSIGLITGGSATSGITINSSGNVGIKTISPTTALYVVGAGTVTGNLTVDGNVGIGTSVTPAAKLGIVGNVGIGSSFAFANVPVNGLAVQGNVGIGTSSPDYALHVIGNVGIGTSLTVSSATSLATLNVSGISSLTGNVGIGSSALINGLTTSLGGLRVNGFSDLTGNVGIGGSVTVSSLSTFLSSILAADGSATAPGLSFNADRDTGIFRPGTNALGFATAGSSKLTLTEAGALGLGITAPSQIFQVNSGGSSTVITSGGNIGIGLTTPASMLDVNGISTFRSHLRAFTGSIDIGTSAIRFGAGYFDTIDATNLAGTVTGGSTSNASWTINSDNASDDTEDASLAFERGTATPNAVFGWDSATKEFDLNSELHITGTITATNGLMLDGVTNDLITPGNENLVLIPGGSGNVGINTTSPYAKLQVRGAGTGTGLTFLTTDSTGAQRLAVLDNGNVGIGVTNPSASLTVHGNVGIGFTNVVIPSNGLAVAGNVGLGTTTPRGQLEVVGNALFLSGLVGIGTTAPGNTLAVNGGLNLGTYASSTGPSNGLAVSGNVGIGTTTPDYPLHVIGNVGIGASATITGLTYASGGLRVNGFSDLTGNVGIGASVVVNGNIYTPLGLRVGGFSDLAGNVGIGASALINGLTTSLGGLRVNGFSDLTGNVGIGGSLTANSLSTFLSSILGSDGSATAPGYAFNLDTDTGIFRPGTNALGLATAGASRLTVTAAGLIGIGITSPAATFQVNSGSSSTVITSTGNIGIGITTANSALSVAGGAHIGSLRQGIAAPTDGLFVDGNVGIGATTSSNALDVWGNARITGSLSIGSAGNITSTGQFLGKSGNQVAAPSYSFDGDTDTGIYSASAGNIQFSSDGVLRYTFSPNTFTFDRPGVSGGATGINLIGITNTAVTAEKNTLLIGGDTQTITGGYTNQRFTLFNTPAVDAASALAVTNAATVTILSPPNESNSAVVTNAMGLWIGNDGGNNASNSYGLFVDSPTGGDNKYAAVFAGTANVGIGTSLPSARLHVAAGNVGIGTSGAGASLAINGNSVIGFGTTSIAGPSSGLAVSGNVGIGTTSPIAPLHVWGNGTNSGLFLNGNIGVGWTSPVQLLQINPTNLGLGLTVPNTFVVTSTGNVGIGNSSPRALLDIYNGSVLQTPANPAYVGGENDGNEATWTFGTVVQGRYAYVAAYDASSNTCSTSDRTGCDLIIFDITNPASPVYVGGLKTPGANGSFYAGMAIAGQYLYVEQDVVSGTCSSTDGTGCEIQVIDVSNPASPVYVGGADNGGTATGNMPRQIFVSGHYLYASINANGGTCNSSTNTGCEFQIYDISNPTSPTYAGGADNGGTAGGEIFVQGRYAYVAASANTGTCDSGTNTGCEFQVYDVSNPVSPTYKGGASISSASAAGITAIFVSGRYAYVTHNANSTACDSSDNTGCELSIFDISNPVSPTFVGGADDGGTNNWGLFVSGRYAYLATGNNTGTCNAYTNTGCEFQVYDVSNPAAPVFVGGADHGGAKNSSSVFVSGRYAYLTKLSTTNTCSSINNGGCELQVFDISGVEATSVVAHSFESGSLQVRENGVINNNLTVGGGLNIGNGGIFSAGSVGIGVTTGGPALFIQQLGTGPAATLMGGNVGIGFTSPDRLLLAGSDINIVGSNASLMGAAGTQFSITGSTANTLTKKLVLGIDTTDNYGVIQAGNTSGTNYALSLNPAGGNVGIGITTANSTLSVAGSAHIGSLFQGTAAPTNGLFVDGNVGIGATTSNNLLDVWGNVGIGQSLNVSSAAALNTLNVSGISSLAGNVGIGGSLTANSLSTFLSSILGADGSATAPGYAFNLDTDTGIFRPSTDALGLATGGASRLTVTGAGFVGIGITSPAATFQVNSGANSTVITSTGNLGIGTTSPRMPLEIWGNGTYAATFLNGNVGIGTTIVNGSLIVGSGGPSGTGNVGIGLTGFAYPSFKLQVAGNIGPDQGPTISATTQTTTTLKTLASTYITSVAIAPDGFPAVVATGATGNGIWYIKCGNADCSSGNTVTNINSGSNYGIYGSLAIGADGLPIISYKDNIAAALMAVHCGNITCTAGNITTTVASETETFDFTSIAVGKDGFPVIAYTSGTAGPVKVAACSNAACSASSIATVDSTAGGTTPTIVIGIDGLPILTYANGNSGGLYVTHCGNAICSSGNTSTLVDSNTQAVAASSIAIGSDGLPVISYYLGTAGDLSVLHCGNTACSAGNTITSAVTANNVGNEPSIAISTDGLPIISHYDSTNLDLLVTRCGNLTCSSGNTTNTVDSTGSIGKGSSIAIGTDGLPVVSYNNTSTAFKLTKCANVGCSATTGTALTGGSSLGGWMPNSRSFGSAFQTLNTYQIANPSTFQRFSILTGGAERLSINPQGNVGIGTSAANGLLDVQKALFGNPSLTGKYLSISASTFTDQTTASSGTTTNMAFNSIAQPTLAASNAPVTTTNAYSFYLAGAPVSGTNELVNNSIALGIAAGAVGTGTTASYGLYVNAQTGAASNYAASFATGNVGIGFTSPGSKLDVFNTTSSSDVDIFRVLSNVTNTGNIKFRVDSDGDVFSDGGTAMGTPADVAENYPVLDENIEAGDLVTTSDIKSDIKNAYGELQPYTEKSNFPYQNNLIGIISTKPGVLLAANTEGRAVALAGRVPVKVSMENGPIEVGDYLTSSSTPGIAMKATRPGSTVGKALEEFAGEEIGKILAFINVSYADPGNFFASLSLDNEGNLIIPKIRTANIILDSSVASASASLSIVNSQLSINEDPNYNSTGPQLANNNNSYDLAGKIASLEDKVKELEARVQVTVDSGQQTATNSAALASNCTLQPETCNLDLTPPDILLATGSATLANLKVTSEATVSGVLAAYDLNISNSLKSLGESILGKTLIAGDLTVDGMLTITGSSLSNLSILYIQNSPLAEGLDIFNGKVIINKEGNITTQGKITASEIQTSKLTISNAPVASSSGTLAASIGSALIEPNTSKVTIETGLVTNSSKIFITPITATDKVLSVTNIKSGESFDVSITSTSLDEIKFNWWIIQTN